MTNNDERKHITTFITQELPTFSIKRFILQNLLNFSNTRLWPVQNTPWPTVWESLLYWINKCCGFNEFWFAFTSRL